MKLKETKRKILVDLFVPSKQEKINRPEFFRIFQRSTDF